MSVDIVIRQITEADIPAFHDYDLHIMALLAGDAAR